MPIESPILRPDSRRLAIRPKYVNHYRFEPGLFNIPREQMVRITADDFFTSKSIQDKVRLGLIKVAHENIRGYKIFAETKDYLPQGFYDIFISAFPHNGHPIIHSLDDLEDEVFGSFFDAVQSGLHAVHETAKANDYKLREMYTYQHIAERDTDFSLPISPTFPHIHWHVFGIPEELDEHQVKEVKMDKRRSLGSAYWDPTAIIALDLIREVFPDAELDKKSSTITVESTHISFDINQTDRANLRTIISFWRSMWKEIAGCFGMDLPDKFNLFPVEQRLENVKRFISSHPELSDSSIEMLIWIANNVQDRPLYINGRYNWSLFARGIHGSMGYRYNFKNDKRTLCIAPRSFAVSDKSAATGGEYALVRNGIEHSNENQIAEISSVQRQILCKMK